MTQALCGRTALVTGGSGGIGSACARALLRDGAAVLLMDRREAALQRTRDELLSTFGGCVEIQVGDALAAADVEAACEKAQALQQRLDIVVATVGGAGFKPLLLHDADSFRADVDLNLTSAFLAIRHAAPRMGAGGSIVCISSTASTLPFAALSSYCASKAALESLVRTAAEELAAAGIRVNAVRPGLTRSDATTELFASPQLMAGFIEQIPLGRGGEPEDIAQGVRYLAGPESAWVTGQSLAVDGGNELRRNPDPGVFLAQIYGDEALRAIRWTR